jgi:phage FluMu gp28-like protein
MEAVDQGLFRRICQMNGVEWTQELENDWVNEMYEFYGDDAAEELDCVPAKSGGAYLSRLLVEDSMVAAPVHRFEPPADFAQRDDGQREAFVHEWLVEAVLPSLARLPKDKQHVFGEDFGRSADLTVIAPLTIEQDLRRRVPFLVELRNVPFREQEQVLYFVADRLPRFSYGALDATGNGQYLAERAWQRYGKARIEQVNLSEKWYGENLPPMKAAFEDSLMHVPRDADVLSDLCMFQVINGIPKMPKIRNVQKAGGTKAMRHGDSGIAIALAHYSSRKPSPQFEYKSAQKRAVSFGAPRRTGKGFRSKAGGVL